MYPEFIAIYIGLLIVIALLVIVMVLLVKNSGNNNSVVPKSSYTSYADSQTTATTSGNMAFCKNCATQFDASQRCCPKCGTPR